MTHLGSMIYNPVRPTDFGIPIEYAAQAEAYANIRITQEQGKLYAMGVKMGREALAAELRELLGVKEVSE
jgi:hypothetical protein